MSGAAEVAGEGSDVGPDEDEIPGFFSRFHLPDWLSNNTSMWLFDEYNQTRIVITDLMEEEWWGRGVLLLILANCIMLVVADPLCRGHGELPAPGLGPCTTESTFCSMEDLQEFPCGIWCASYVSTRPGYVCNPITQLAVDRSEIFFTIAFTLEMLAGIVAKGFVFHHAAYLRSLWNVLDFIVVIFSWVGYLPGVSSLTMLRAIRVLRPLRTLNKVPGLRPLVESLFRSFDMLINVVGLFLFVYFLFGITGVQLLKGKLRTRCVFIDDPYYNIPAEAVGPTDFTRLCSTSGFGRNCPDLLPAPNGTLLRTACSGFYSDGSNPRIEFPNPEYYQGLINFDNILYGFFAIFQVIAIEGWSEIWYHYEEGWNIYLARFYFCLLVTLGAFIIINLALAVMSDNFTICFSEDKEERAELGNQDDDVSIATTVDSVPPPPPPPRKPSKGSLLCLKIVEHTKFQNFIMGCILVNVLILSVDYHSQEIFEANWLVLFEDGIALNNTWVDENCDQDVYGNYIYEGWCGALVDADGPVSIDTLPSNAERFLSGTNYFLTAMFTLEVLMKMWAYGLKQFRADGYNNFDLVVVIASIVEIALSVVLRGGPFKRALSVFRMLRIFRIFKLARAWESFAQILSMLSAAAVSVGPLLILFFLFVFIFSLLGMSLFGGQMKYQFPDVVGSNPRNNFDGFLPDKGPEGGYGAMVTIFEILTGDSWNFICYNGVRATNYFSFVYFCLLVLLGIYILLNLFLAVLLHGAAQKSQEVEDMMLDSASPQELEKAEQRARFLRKMGRIFCFVCRDLFEEPNQDDTQADSVSEVDSHAVDLSDIDSEPEYDPMRPMEEQLRRRKPISLRPEYEPGKQYEKQWPKEASQKQQWQTSSSLKTVVEQANIEEEMDGAEEPSVFNSSSLFIFSTDNRLRELCRIISENTWFSRFIIVCILINSLMMALEDPSLDPDDPLVLFMKQADLVFAIIFLVEFVLKVVSLGFLMHPGAYLRDGWNILDFFIVLVSLISVSVTNVKDVKALRFRVLRVLRPLRMMKRFPGLRLVVNCLIASVPPIMNLVMVSALIFLTFCILGMQLYKGKFYTCQESAVPVLPTWLPKYDIDYDAEGVDAAEVLEQIMNKTNLLYSSTQLTQVVEPDGHVRNVTNWYNCKLSGGMWVQDKQHFDNVFKGMLTLFMLASQDSWSRVMNLGLDAGSQPGTGLIRMQNPGQVIYFVFFLFIGSFFVLNLFIGVVYENYTKMQESKVSGIMTEAQKRWVVTMRALLRERPQRPLKPPSNPVSIRVFAVVMSRRFEQLVMLMIVLNAMVMGSDMWNAVGLHVLIMQYCNFVFTVFFMAESMIKMVAFGVRGYFRVGWNIFDFIISVTSVIALVPFASGLSMLQIFRVFRLLRFFRQFVGLNKLLSILIFSIPSLLNVGALMILLVYIYAVVGVQLFWNVKHGPLIDDHSNFSSFSHAFFTLFRVMTGVQWTGIMTQCSYDKCEHCNPTWLLTGKCDSGCGGEITAYGFFVTFVVVSVFIMLNLFIAIILDNFTQEMSSIDTVVGKRNIRQLSTLWLQYDPDATLVLHHSQLFALLRRLPPPLGCRVDADRKEIYRLMANLDILLYRGYFTFDDLFHALSYQLVGVELPSAVTKHLTRQRIRHTRQRLKRKLGDEFKAMMKEQTAPPPSGSTTPKTPKAAKKAAKLVLHSTLLAECNVEEALAASIIQSCWRAYRFRCTDERGKVWGRIMATVRANQRKLEKATAFEQAQFQDHEDPAKFMRRRPRRLSIKTADAAAIARAAEEQRRIQALVQGRRPSMLGRRLSMDRRASVDSVVSISQALKEVKVNAGAEEASELMPTMTARDWNRDCDDSVHYPGELSVRLRTKEQSSGPLQSIKALASVVWDEHSSTDPTATMQQMVSLEAQILEETAAALPQAQVPAAPAELPPTAPFPDIRRTQELFGIVFEAEDDVGREQRNNTKNTKRKKRTKQQKSERVNGEGESVPKQSASAEHAVSPV